MQYVFASENEVSWDVYPDLTDADWHLMLPGKVGVVRKIKQLLQSQVCEKNAAFSKLNSMLFDYLLHPL